MGRSVKQEDNFDLVCIGLYKFIGTVHLSGIPVKAFVWREPNSFLHNRKMHL